MKITSLIQVFISDESARTLVLRPVHTSGYASWALPEQNSLSLLKQCYQIIVCRFIIATNSLPFLPANPLPTLSIGTGYGNSVCPAGMSSSVDTA